MEVGDLHHPRSCSPEGETVCAALARHENTLRDAIREMHLDISSFKLGVERRLEEAVNLSGPLGRAVAQLQQENRQLRTQLQALTRQVELLSGALSDHSSWVKDRHQEVKEVFYGKGQAHLHVQPCSLGGHAHLNSQSSPPPATTFSPHPSASSPVTSRGSSLVSSSSSPSTTRFSSRATFAVSSKNNSIERDEPIDVDLAPTHLQNGHAVAEQSGFVHGKISPPTDVLLEHTAPVSMRMPHLPVTATTKTADVRSSSSVSSPTGPTPLSDTSHLSRSAASATQPLPRAESPPPPARTLAPVRAVGPPSRQEKSEKTSPSPAKSVTYLALQRHDSDDDTSKDRPPRQVGGKRRELVRSQTLPRNIGAQAHRPVFERSDSHHRPADSKPALKRSQSFGVSSASSIKQILLDWCRSKTVGYQKIDIQNFSSSWSDGMAFCALVHSFFPSEFDYESLSPADRKHNFELAFGTAEATAGCDRLIEVDDMMIMGCKPDPMCVFTYVQSLYNHLRRFE